MATVLHPHVDPNASLTDLKGSLSTPSPSAPLDEALKSSLLAPNPPAPTPTGLFSLPPELILYILELMCPPSLLVTARTNRSLHYLAYSIYLVRIGLGPQSGHLLLFNDESSRVLGTLNAALFKPELKSITCVLQSREDMVIRARREIDAFKKLLGKLVSLTEFHLDFMDFKEYVASTAEEEKEMNVKKRVKLDVVKELAWILDAIVGLGCRRITICLLGPWRPTGGVKPEDVKPNVIEGVWGLKNYLLEFLPDGFTNVIYGLQQEKYNRLEVFNLHSPVLLDNKFFKWTVDTLNYSRITTLSLNQMALIPAYLWSVFLPLLYLPHLTTLLVDVVVFKPQDAFAFLERHPRLEKLHIGSNAISLIQYHPNVEVEVVVPEGILPNLKHIAATPSFLVQCLSSPGSFPKLSEVTILEAVRPGSDFHLDTLRSTLSPITPRLLQIPNVQLTVSFRSQVLSLPTPSAVPPDSPLPDIITRLTHLELQIHVYRLSDEARQDFPALIGSFPGLKSLEFTTVSKSGPVEDSQWVKFVKDICRRCRTLERVCLNGELRAISE